MSSVCGKGARAAPIPIALVLPPSGHGGNAPRIIAAISNSLADLILDATTPHIYDTRPKMRYLGQIRSDDALRIPDRHSFVLGVGISDILDANFGQSDQIGAHTISLGSGRQIFMATQPFENNAVSISLGGGADRWLINCLKSDAATVTLMALSRCGRKAVESSQNH